VTSQAQTPSKSSPAGLEGVTAGNSALSLVDGAHGKLDYCGIPIEPLAEQGTFEECIYLLWYDQLPTAVQLDEIKQALRSEQQMPGEVWDVLRPLAGRQSLMDLLRTGISVLSAFDDEVASTREEIEGRRDIELRVATRLQAKIGPLVAGSYRLAHGQAPLDPRDDLSLAGNFLYLLTGEEAGEYEERIFDAALTLHADHGFNASTFAARVTAGTEADVYAAVTAAVGALGGRLHGGANMRVMRMLEEIGDISQVDSFIDAILDRPKGRVMGFGHRVYKAYDPRAVVLRRMSEELTKRTGNTRWFEMSCRIEERVHARKKLLPNVDFFSASVYASLGLDPEIFTPIFAVSRASGWLAHVLEQHADNRLIRPRANYVGERNRPFVPLAER
jgi:citrate synthase